MEAVATERTKSKSHFRWVIGALIFIVYTVAAADRANLGVALPFLRKEFVMSNTEAGALASIFLFAYSLAQLPSGLAYTRFGIPRVFSLAMLATSVFTGLIGTASSLLMLKVYRFGLGLAEGPLPIGITSTINNWFPAREKGTMTGIFLAAAKFGPVLVPPVCAVIIHYWGWRYIFYIFAMPGLVLSVVWLMLVKNRPSESPHVSEEELQHINDNHVAGSTTQAPARKRDFALLDRLIRTSKVATVDTNRDIFRSWNIMGAALGYFFMTAIMNVLLAWIPTYLISVKGYSVTNMGMVAAAPWVGAVIGNLLGGMMTDRLLDKRRKPAMLISAFFTTIMMVILINSPADPFLYGALLLLTGILLNIGYSTYMVYPMGMTSRKVYPMASAMVNTLGQLGGACAPLIAGLLLDNYSWSYVWVFLAVCSVLCFITILTIREPAHA
ncbi:MAG TPA: MFS transporter [Herbaspirillum sp.]|uniref:MFS transporter n=1 Tax=Herbaspirillum sp. TaxID=1890675 RepID=UPI002D53310D|nr:MFS transporter [Herbaspirillum sp.]HZG22093.1 MFS transporter [Herbaspirillum sp.]